MTAVQCPVDRLTQRAVEAINARRFIDAARLCRKLLQRYPEAYHGHACLAEMRYAQGYFEEVVYHYDVVLDMLASNPDGSPPDLVEQFLQLRQHAFDLSQP